jgi:hypothetical protein
MARTVTYGDDTAVRAALVNMASGRIPLPSRARKAMQGVPARRDRGGDGYAEKLAKFVPAEVIAVFTPVMAAWNASRAEVIGALVVGAGLNWLYLVWQSSKADHPDKKPRWFFYVLATLAFGAWAIGTSADVQKLIDLTAAKAGTVLAVAVFIVPILDDILLVLDKRFRTPTPEPSP